MSNLLTGHGTVSSRTYRQHSRARVHEGNNLSFKYNNLGSDSLVKGVLDSIPNDSTHSLLSKMLSISRPHHLPVECAHASIQRRILSLVLAQDLIEHILQTDAPLMRGHLMARVPSVVRFVAPPPTPTIPFHLEGPLLLSLRTLLQFTLPNLLVRPVRSILVSAVVR